MIELNKMKSSENCFLEILNSIDNLKRIKDEGSSLVKSVITWSKCRNFKGIDYCFDGYINIDKDIQLYYFFSNQRSHISLVTDNIEDNINNLQYNLLLYTEYLFKSYSIDMFINNLINTN
jgi:hypothetical protein